ncbi:hypothetical protein BN946_scf184768.g3 [Trametes cinnabarina]|uniref:GH16 domain-containing protein n=1 Tax=Pycnoporus cinnabarinus TaxID=5643 RepID=A0A060SP26_PYCCI|nr:hypothetical protein BN946_scf184768.g3 [Trametes cinnabarina]
MFVSLFSGLHLPIHDLAGPSSSLWLPPCYPFRYPLAGMNSLLMTFPRKAKPPMLSLWLSHNISAHKKLWHKQRESRHRALNGEFQMLTGSSDNRYAQDGQLYIMATLTSDKLRHLVLVNGGWFDLGDTCTTSNKLSNGNGSPIQPVQSARISTMNSTSLAFGKVKLHHGSVARSYPAQGVNYVCSLLNYGVLQSVLMHLFGWWSQKQSWYDKDFHVYAMEWTPHRMRFYVDNRLQVMANLKIAGKAVRTSSSAVYPATATNGSNVAVVVQNICEQAGGSTTAPFDQGWSLRTFSA